MIFDKLYIRSDNSWIMNVWAIENCIVGICSIEHKMRPILQTVWMAQQANNVKIQRCRHSPVENSSAYFTYHTNQSCYSYSKFPFHCSSSVILKMGQAACRAPECYRPSLRHWPGLPPTSWHQPALHTGQLPMGASALNVR